MPTFADLAVEWMRTRGALKRSRKTDETLLRAHLVPAFGALELASIDQPAIERFVAGCSVRPASVNRILTLLRAMLKFAKLLGWIALAPVVKLLRTPKRVDFRFLRTDDEVRRFLRAARDVKVQGYRPGFVGALYATAVHTGLRLGELCALRRGSIDSALRLIAVRESHDGPTKSDATRHVPILDALRAQLEEHLLSSSAELVFPSARGRRLNRGSKLFRHVFRRVLVDAGLPERYITFHCLRHTFASHWVMKAGEIFKLQKILGHSSIQMTMIYAHLAPNAFAEDLARFNPLLPDRPGEIVQLPLLARGV